MSLNNSSTIFKHENLLNSKKYCKMFMNESDEFIINILSKIHPIELLYYEIINLNFIEYNKKLPKEYLLFQLDDIAINFIEKILDIRIIEKIIKLYIDNNDIMNLNIFYEKFYNYEENIIFEFIKQNKHAELQIFMIFNLYNNNHADYNQNNFNHHYCISIISRGDNVELLEVFRMYHLQFPHKIKFNINYVLKAALIYGRELCMYYALNNGAMYLIEDTDDYDPSLEILDTLIYAIIGKKLICVKTIYERLFEHFKNDNLINYINFSAIYAGPDVVAYLINLRLGLFDKDIYNDILKHALCNANIENVKFAIINGAIYTFDMNDFVEEYNTENYRSESVVAIDDDYFDFWHIRHSLPENFNLKYKECIDFINSQ
jgi:hypothetical protein